MASTETLKLGDDDGRIFNAYLTRPTEGRSASVMVLHDMFGLNDPIPPPPGTYETAWS